MDLSRSCRGRIPAWAGGDPASVLSGIVAVFGLSLAAATGFAAEFSLGDIRVPPGFRVALYAEVPNARSMTLGERGTLFVGTRHGEVYGVLPGETPEGMRRVVTVARNLHSPNGVAFRGDALYVAEIRRILRYDRIESRLSSPPEPVVVNESLPTDEHHGWKFIRFGPDGMLYVPVGAPCDICERADPRYAAILRMRPDGSLLVSDDMAGRIYRISYEVDRGAPGPRTGKNRSDG